MATNGRLRDYLTREEVRALLRAARQGKRYGARNVAMILLAYRHGFRASELVELRIADVDFRAGTIHCRRRKGSRSTVHPVKRDELCHRPAYWSHSVIGIWEPGADRHIGARA